MGASAQAGRPTGAAAGTGPAAMAIDVQVSASHVPWPAVRDAARRAEEHGFDALWVFDHLAGEALGGERSLECFTWLGALAASTSRIELGALVANVWNRGVGTLAVAAASVVEIARRPFHLGIGAGASPTSRWAAEQHAVGHEVRERIADRHARVEAVLDLTDRLWRPDRDAELATFPAPRPLPTRVVGTNSVALAELAGRRAEGVNVAWEHPRRDELLAAARTAAGGRSFSLTAWVPWRAELLDPDHPVRRSMDDAGLDRVILTVSDEVDRFLR